MINDKICKARKWRCFVVFLICSMSLAGYFAEHHLYFSAHAATLSTQTREISYIPHLSQQLVQNEYYSARSSVSVNVSIQALEGKKIAKITQQLANGVLQDITPPAAKSSRTYQGVVNLQGTSQLAKSTSNDSLKGYYAWYRKKANNLDPGNWYAELQNANQSVRTVTCHSSEKEKVSQLWISAYPGCSSRAITPSQPLSLQARLNRSFQVSTSSVSIPNQAVTDIQVSNVYVNTSSQISGPAGVQAGYAIPGNIEIIGVTPVSTSSDLEYQVKFHQNFNYRSNYGIELSQPPNGTKLMIYYASFVMDLAAKTYQYPKTVLVEYVAESGSLPNHSSTPASQVTPTPTRNPPVPTDQTLPADVTIQWQPAPIWEGDTVRIWAQMSNNPDTLWRYKWVIQEPDGQVYDSYSSEVVKTWTKPGAYQVALTVSDGSMSYSVHETISVAALQIQADLGYTAEWLIDHKKRKHQTTFHPKDFYSGERIMVYAIGSQAPIQEVVAWLDTRGIDNHSIRISQRLKLSTEPQHYVGDIFSSTLQSMKQGLPNGEHSIEVKITYQNGVIKQTKIPLKIIGNIHKALGIQRLQ